MKKLIVFLIFLLTIGVVYANELWFKLYQYEDERLILTSPISGDSSIYGEMWNYTSNASSWTFTIPASSVYYNFTGLVAGNLKGFNFNDGNQTSGGSRLTTATAGLYSVNFQISMEGLAAGGLHGMGVVVNYDVTANRDCYSRHSGSASVMTMGVTCLLDLNINDIVNLQIEDEDSPSKNINIHTVNLNLVRIGD